MWKMPTNIDIEIRYNFVSIILLHFSSLPESSSLVESDLVLPFVQLAYLVSLSCLYSSGYPHGQWLIQLTSPTWDSFLWFDWSYLVLYSWYFLCTCRGGVHATPLYFNFHLYWLINTTIPYPSVCLYYSYLLVSWKTHSSYSAKTLFLYLCLFDLFLFFLLFIFVFL